MATKRKSKAIYKPRVLLFIRIDPALKRALQREADAGKVSMTRLVVDILTARQSKEAA